MSAIAKAHQNKPTRKRPTQPANSPQDGSARRKWAEFQTLLLDWYDVAQRDLPWRHTKDAYAIWVSEIMLQQTRVAVVVERYKAFMARFPTLILWRWLRSRRFSPLWSGLGYYRRARMLHKAAQLVADTRRASSRHAAELRKLPGIGPYTAAAIASIAHGEPVAVVDGNVERVICRLRAGSGAAGGGAGLRRKIDEAGRADG